MTVPNQEPSTSSEGEKRGEVWMIYTEDQNPSAHQRYVALYGDRVSEHPGAILVAPVPVTQPGDTDA